MGLILIVKEILKLFFKKNTYDYRGTINDHKFKIKQNNALSSINDGTYFFLHKLVVKYLTMELNEL